jgi:peptidoglycan hydrolase-like protein with peptidoglycan-binding domain
MTATPTTTATTDSSSSPSPTTGRTRAVAIGAVGILAGAVMTAAVVLGMQGGSTTPSTTQAPVSTAPTAAHVPAAHPRTTPTPAAVPSPAIETVQRELGQLNYYEGPITGTMNSQTVAAVTYLQRDAHLPQTGVMDATTHSALVTMLAHGNNQMGS